MTNLHLEDDQKVYLEGDTVLLLRNETRACSKSAFRSRSISIYWQSRHCRQVSHMLVKLGYRALSCSTILQFAREKRASLNAAPLPARSALSPNGSQQPSRSRTPRQPKAVAVRNKVPMFPGSCTRSKTRALPCVISTQLSTFLASISPSSSYYHLFDYL